METIKIEKGIEITRKSAIYPFEKMEIGDSFFVLLKNGQKIGSLQATLGNCAKSYTFYNDSKAKFTTRKEDNGVRIWRIK